MSRTRWRVMRQDDNGNVYLVAETATEGEACTIARMFEARGHRQLYSVEPFSTAPEALPYR
ncbi:MAG: SPOR domain-containing protein [Acidobacteriota bacterium]